MKKILIAVFLLVGVAAQSQTTNIYGDTVKLRARVGGNAEFVVQNATRDTLGFLYNIGGGVTIFKTINTLDSTGAKDTVWVKKQLKIPIKDTSAYSSHQQGRITFAPSDNNYYGDNGLAWILLSGGGGGGGEFGKDDILAGENRSFDANNFNFGIHGADTLLLSGDNVLLGEGVTKMSLQSLGTTELLSTDSLNLNGAKTNITGTNIVTNGTNINSNGTDVTNYGSNTNKWGRDASLGWQTDLTALYAKGLTYSSNTTRKFLSIDSITGKLNYTTFPTTYFDGLLGGTAGQILVKNSTTYGDYSFQTFAGSPFAMGAVPTVGTQSTKNVIYPVVATDSMYFGTYAGGSLPAKYSWLGTGYFSGQLKPYGGMDVGGTSTFTGDITMQSGAFAASVGTNSSRGSIITATANAYVTPNSNYNAGVSGANVIGSVSQNLNTYDGKNFYGVYGTVANIDGGGTGTTTGFITGLYGYVNNQLIASTTTTMYGVTGAMGNKYSSNMTAYGLYARFVNGSVTTSTELGGLLIDSIGTAYVKTGLPFGIKQKGSNMVNFLAGNTMIGYTGAGAVLPVASAALQVNSTTQGFLPPRMTTAQRTAISSPAEGLCVYDTDLHKLSCWDGSSWQFAW